MALKKYFTTTIFLLSMTSLCSNAQRPVVQTNFTPDPAPMVYDDTFYIYTGHDEDGEHNEFVMNEWRVYSSKDMVNWTDHGSPMSLDTFKWSESGAWASQCVERDGKFYWYVCCVDKATHDMAIGVAVADSPTGPFKDPIGAPLVNGHGGYIDPTVFIEPNGDAWLYWGNPGLWCCKLNRDMISYDHKFEIKGDHAEKVADGVWKFKQDENSFGGPEKLAEGTVFTDYKDLYEEGPWFYKRGDRYILAYAAGGVPEHISYSVSKTPYGPWKYAGQIMPLQQMNSFTNHCGIVEFRGANYFCYHCGTLPGGSGFNRSTAIERFDYNPDGSIPVILPSDKGLEPVGTLNPYSRVEAETMAWSEGLKTEPNAKTGIYVSDIHDGDFLQVRSVDFGDKGARSLTASAASALRGGRIDVYLDSVSGKHIASIEIHGTGGWENWTSVKAPLYETVTGVHDLTFVFRGRKGCKLFNFDYWKFE